jgi:hypothetical protein
MVAATQHENLLIASAPFRTRGRLMQILQRPGAHADAASGAGVRFDPFLGAGYQTPRALR